MAGRFGLALAMSVIACGLAAGPAAALRVWMQEGDIRKDLVGQQLSGIYPNGLEWTEQIRTDGTSDYREGGRSHPGRWTLKGELFCFSYPAPTMGGCFRVVRRGVNCYELYTASYGGTVPAQPPPASEMSWNGRMWSDAARPTCEEKEIS
ncbi:MAG: hypothetical protein AB7G35_24885 [Hyphomicrobiaceae bacterium]